MSALTVFVTGTDTGVGKTHLAVHLLRQARAHGIRCAGFKPVAAGGVPTPAGVRNEDALALQDAGSVALPYDTLNPYALPEAIAPHLAAASAGLRIEPQRILQCHAQIAAQADLVVVEGAGGWHVPLDDGLLYSDLVAQAGWPVLLVVGMRLGCLNHALLSAEAIGRRARLAAWVANCLPPLQPRLADNLQALAQRLPAPLLGQVPMADSAGRESWPGLDIERLLAILR